MINFDSITPLYLQVKEHILSDIQGEKYQPSGRLPSEKELAALYNVSIITIRRAISELVEESHQLACSGTAENNVAERACSKSTEKKHKEAEQ